MAKKSPKKRTGNSPRYKFSVYISSPTPKSDSALARLRKICDEKIPADYEIKVVDLSKHPEQPWALLGGALLCSLALVFAYFLWKQRVRGKYL